ncbi:hypothetical protein [Aeromonas phage BUCT552]|nr:hypothetical protein [Aeromonas phage BUCT552]
MSIWSSLRELFASTGYGKQEFCGIPRDFEGLILHVSPAVGRMIAADMRDTVATQNKREARENVVHAGKGNMIANAIILEQDMTIRRKSIRCLGGARIAVNPELQDEQIRIDFVHGIKRTRNIRFSQQAAAAMFISLAESQDRINNPKILSAADRFIEVLRSEKLTPAAAIALEGLEDIIRQYAKDMEARK